MISAQALHLGMFILPWSVLLVLIGLISVWLMGKYLQRRAQWQQPIWQNYKDALWSSLWVGLICARLIFVLMHLELYLIHPLDIIKVQDKGFNLYAGMMAGAIWFLWKNRILNFAVLLSALLLFTAVQLTGIGLIKYYTPQQHYPDLIFHDLQQQPQSLQQFIGKPVVMNLWASWCPPCHREMPVLHQAQQDYPELQFIMLNQAEDPEEIATYLKSHQFSFKIVLSDPQAEMAQYYKMYGMPSTLFFNAQGQLIASHMGELSHAMLQQYIQKTLNSSDAQQ